MSKAVVDYSVLRSCLQKGISFAAYSLPGDLKFSFIAQREGVEIIDSLKNNDQGFIIYPFYTESNHPILLIKNDFFLKEGDKNKNVQDFIQSKEDYLKLKNSEKTEQNKENYCAGADLQSVPHNKISAKAQTKTSALADKDKYLQLFKTFKQTLDKGEFKKLVLSRVKNIKVADSFDIIDLFKKLNQIYPNSFNHISFTPKSGIWLGASPEILLSIDDERAKTVALAGTQKKNNSSNYIWEDKEIEEQRFVINYVQNILENQFPKSHIEITNKTIEAGQMVHLRTHFSFPSKHIKNLPAFLKELHPTPAVCGLPKEKARQFITQTEKHDRTYYSGFLGPINLNEQTHLFVNLRCLKFEGKTLSLFVGGGLTKDSIGEKEWAETELKATTLQSLL